MHLWAIHPKYMDKHSLIASWREGLRLQKALAENNLEAKNKMSVFKSSGNPLRDVGSYLSFMASEGARQGVKLNHEKIICPNFDNGFASVRPEDIKFETEFLKQKLRRRDQSKFQELVKAEKVETNPVFNVQ